MAELWRPQLVRVPPAHPRQAYRTYTVVAGQRRLVSCNEVGCRHHLEGWATVCDPASSLGAEQAALIRSGRTGRRYIEGRHEITVEDDGTVRAVFTADPAAPGDPIVFAFHPGQRCFREHYITAGPEQYWVREGDHRGGQLIRRHTRAVDWVEDQNEQHHRRAVARQRG